MQFATLLRAHASTNVLKCSYNLGNNYIVFVPRVTSLPTVRCFETCASRPAVLIMAIRSFHRPLHISVGGMATTLRTVYNRGILVRIPGGAINSCLRSVQTCYGNHPASYSMGIGSEAAGSSIWPPTSSSDEVKNEWNYTFISSDGFMACRGTNFALRKCWDNTFSRPSLNRASCTVYYPDQQCTSLCICWSV